MKNHIAKWWVNFKAQDSHFQQATYMMVAWLMLVGFLVVFGSRVASIAPFFGVLLSWVWFIIPGLFVSRLLLKRLSWIEMIPVAFVLALGISTPITIVAIQRKISLDTYILLSMGPILAIYLIYAIYVLRFRRSKGDVSEDCPEYIGDKLKTGWIPFIVVLVFVTGYLAFLAKEWIPMGDDLAAFPYFSDTLRMGRITNVEPYHGSETAPTPRMELIVYGYQTMLLDRLSGTLPEQFLVYSRSILVVLSLLAVYTLASQFFKNRQKALYTISLWAIYLLSTLSLSGTPGATRSEGAGNDLVTHIFQDKYLSWFIIVPIALVFMLWFLESRRFRYLIGFFIGVFGAALAHPVTFILLLILIGGYGIIYLVIEHSRKALNGLLYIGIVLVLCLIIPIYQYIRFNQPMPVYLAGLADVVEYGKIYMSVNRSRIWLLDNGAFILHPSKILQPVILVGYALLPVLFFQLRKSNMARLVVGSMIALPLLLYVPFLAKLTGTFVTPILIWRLAWPLALLAVLAIGSVSWDVINWLSSQSKRINQNLAYPLQLGILYVCVVAAFIIGKPHIEAGIANFYEQRGMVSSTICEKSIDAVKYLDQLTYQQPKNVLADYKLNFCIPAYAAFANVVEYRGLATINRLPEDEISEAIQRVEDVNYFTLATRIDDRVMDMLDQWDIDYVLLEKDRLELDMQFRHIPELFSQIYSDQNFAIYKVQKPVSPTTIIEGNIALQQDKWDQAEELFMQAAREDPTQVLAYVGLGQAQEGKGELDLAISSFQKAADLLTGEAYVHTKLANAYFIQGEVDNAVEEYQRAIALDPDRFPIHASLGKAYLIQGQEQKAEKSFQKMASLLAQEDTANYYSLLGYALASADKPSLAIPHFEKAISIDPDPSRYLYLARALAQSGDVSGAIEMYDQAIKVDPWMHQPHLEKGILKQGEGEIDSAIEEFEKSWRLNPTSGSTYIMLGQAIQEKSGVTEAIARLEKLKSLNRVLPGPHLGLVPLYIANGDLKTAFQELDYFTFLQPKNAYAYSVKGYLLSALEQLDEAKQSYDKALALSPELTSARLGLSSLYMRNAEYGQETGELYQIISSNPTTSWPYLMLSNAYQRRGEWDKAKSELEWALNLDPENILGYLYYGDFYQSRNQWQPAIDAYQQVLELDPENATALLKLGEVYQSLGDYDSAQTWLNQAVEKDPGLSNAQKKLAEVYWQQGRYDDSVNILETAADKYPDTDLFTLLAETYRKLGNTDDALSLYQRVNQVSPMMVGNYIAWAQLEMELYNSPAAALDLYYAAVEANPESSFAYNAIGRFFLSQGKLGEAETAFLSSLSLSGDTPDTYLALSDLEILLGDWKSAQEVLQTAVELFPSTGRIPNDLADLYMQRGEFEKAQESYEQAIAAEPGLVSAYVKLAQLFQYRGDFDSAQRILNDALAKNPAAADVYFSLASLYEEFGDINQAEEVFRKATRIAPADVNVYVRLAEFYQRQNRPDKAIETLQLAKNVPLTEVGPTLAIGDLFLVLNRPEEASSFYDTALSINRVDPRPHLAYANLYQSQGRWDQARRELNTALSVQPNDFEVNLALGNFYRQIGRFDDAKTYFERAASLDRNRSEPYLSLGNLYRNIGNWSQAIESLEKAIEISPTDLSAYTALGRTYQIMGNASEAQSAYSRGILNSLDKQEAYLARAGFYYSQIKGEQAESDFKAAWELNPNSYSMGLQLADYYRRVRDYEKAIEVLGKLEGTKSEDARINIAKGNILAEQAMWPEALEEYNKAITINSSYLDAHTGIAKVYEKIGKMDQAIAIYSEAIEDFQDDPEAFINLGLAHKARKNYAAAKSAFEKALSLDFDNAIAMINLDQLSRSVNEPERELSPFIARVKTAPTADAYTNLGHLFQLRGKWQVAKYWLMAAINLDPYNSYSWLRLGYYYVALAQWDQALEAFNQALKYEPNSSSILLAIGDVHYQLENTDKAMEAYQQAIETEPGNIDGYLALANLQHELGETEQAIATINAGIENVPADIQAYQTLSAIYSDIGETDQAMAAINAGMEKVPGAADLYVNIGDIYTDQVLQAKAKLDAVEALELLAEARVDMRQTQVDESENERQKRYAKLKLSEAVISYTAAHNLFLATQPTYEQLGSQFDEAVANYQRALELQPTNELALLGLGKLYLAVENPEEALNYFHQAVEAHPSSSLSLGYLANTYLELNSPNEAIEASERILIYEPDNLLAHLNISKAHQQMKLLDVTLAARSIEHSQFLIDSLVDYYRQSEIRGPEIPEEARTPFRPRPARSGGGNIRDLAPTDR